MNFLRDRQCRRYFFFVLCAAGFFLCAAVFLSWNHLSWSAQLLLRQRETVSSYLLSRNISPDIIASALKNNTVSQSGADFLTAAGYGADMPFTADPLLFRSALLFLLLSLFIAAAAGVLLLFGTVYFLKAREHLFQRAADIIAEFSEGNFQNHLPSDETGILYQLFFSVEQLASALQAKNSFEHKAKEFLKDTISDISHQLKTPVAALKLYLDIILQEPDNAETVKTFSEKAEASLNRMEQLILTLLKMTRLDAGSIPFHRENCSVAAMVKKAAGDLVTRACLEQKSLIFEGDADALLFCDPGWTQEALSNLIKNALDHTCAGDTVTVRWNISPGLFRLAVADTGEGIAPEDLPHIFKRFYRSRHSSSSGFGLGLPLARSIIEDQGGMIFVESAPGRGSVFTISFLTDL